MILPSYFMNQPSAAVAQGLRSSCLPPMLHLLQGSEGICLDRSLDYFYCMVTLFYYIIYPVYEVIMYYITDYILLFLLLSMPLLISWVYQAGAINKVKLTEFCLFSINCCLYLKIWWPFLNISLRWTAINSFSFSEHIALPVYYASPTFIET